MIARIAAILICAASVSFGQISNCWSGGNGGYDENIARFIAGTNAGDLDELVEISRNTRCFADFAVRLTDPSGRQRLAIAFEHARTDKLVGAPASTSGTSSLVSRGTAAKALGFATEYGALSQSINGQIVTFTGNLAGIPAVLAREGILDYCDTRTGAILGKPCVHATALRALRRVSFGVSFDASRGTQNLTGTTTGTAASNQPVPVQFQPSRQQVSNVTARVELMNHRDVASEEYQRTWADTIKTSSAITGAGNAALTAVEGSIGDYTKTPVYIAWAANARQQLISAKANKSSKDTITQLWTDLLRDLVGKLSAANADFTAKLTNFQIANQAFDLAEDEFVDNLATKGLLTFEYVNNRPAAQSPTSTFRLIGEHGLGTKNNFTFNVAFSIYDCAQPPVNGVATSRWRDIQLGGQYERSLGKLATLGAAALQFSGYFQNQRTPNILTVDPANPIPGVTFTNLPTGATQVFTEKGNIGIGQIRFVLAPGATSARIPIAVSWSNRTELIDKPTWRAQIGIAYDFDALLGTKK